MMAYIKDEFRAASWVNVLISVWLIVAPFLLGFALLAATWNSVLVGLAMLCVAAFEAARPLRKPGLIWINFALGLWLMLSPFVLGFSSALWPTLLHVGMGAIVAILAGGTAVGARLVRR